MSRFPAWFNKSRTQHDNNDPPWTNVGNAEDHLLRELEALYWVGVNQQLDCIISTLQHWRQSKFEDVVFPDADPKSSMVNGFDTFINQVIPKTPIKSKAIIVPPLMNENADKTGKTGQLFEHLHRYVIERAEEKTRRKINIAVHERLVERPAKEDPVQRRACLLLQGAGFLDIEKTIEYHPRSSTPPIAPQLWVRKKLLSRCPVVEGLPCSECKKNIWGCMFNCTTATSSTMMPRIVCENCYWDLHYGDPAYVKYYQFCIRDRIVDAFKKHHPCLFCRRYSKRVSRPRSWKGGRPVFMLADAKYRGIQKAREGSSLSPKGSLGKMVSRVDRSRSSDPSFLEDKWLFEEFVQENPWKDVSMAVRIGPLVIENGFNHATNGVTIILHDPTYRNTSQNKNDSPNIRLAVRSGETRQLYRQDRYPSQKPKRLQAVLKQVVGTPFTSRVLSTAENEIVSLIVKVSSTDRTDHTRSTIELRDKLKTLLSPWVSIYLQSIAERLLDPQVALTWHATKNNCNQFCEALLDYRLFGPLVSQPSVVPPSNGPLQPLYRISFLCRPGVFTQPPFTTPESATDVPYGLTEDYLRRFWFRCSNGPNLIDSLHGYWFDWAGLNRNIYPHQNLFPWDCTEALLRYPGKCGKCSLAKHLWAFPFDSWSIIAFHLLQDRCMYPENTTTAAKDVDVAWMNKRLTLLTALDTLCAGATAMSQEPLFHKATEWLHTQTDPTVERVKLGGIHRAQPRSHALEKRPYDEFLIAPWTRVSHHERKAYYERAREQFRAPEVRWNYDRTIVSENEPKSVVYHQYTPARVVALSKDYIPNARFTSSSIRPDSHGACGTQISAGGCSSNCTSCGSGYSGGCGGGCGGGGGGGSGGGGSGGGGG